MKNYICTAEGFMKSAGFSQEEQDFVIIYTEKVREAQAFNTKTAMKFMENHGIKGFVWKPHEQEAVRNMYVVRKRSNFGKYIKNTDNDMLEWIVDKIVMVHDSDVSFLMSNKINADIVMTFEEAKTKALELNMELIRDLSDKVKELSETKEP